MGSDITAIATFNNTLLPNALFYFNPTWGGKIGLLNYLFSQKNVDVNIKGEYGYTLLHVACKYINKLPLDVFKVLIEIHGADVNAQDNSKDTPLHVALNFFRQENGGDIAVLTYLLAQNNVNVDITGQKGCHLLHLICINNLSSTRSAELKSKIDATLGQIAEIIAERCIQQVLDEMTL
jgi:ankyrin repeat protein